MTNEVNGARAVRTTVGGKVALKKPQKVMGPAPIPKPAASSSSSAAAAAPARPVVAVGSASQNRKVCFILKNKKQSILDLPITITIGDAKKQLQSEHGINESLLVLYGGQVISDDTLISDLPDATIYVSWSNKPKKSAASAAAQAPVVNLGRTEGTYYTYFRFKSKNIRLSFSINHTFGDARETLIKLMGVPKGKRMILLLDGKDASDDTPLTEVANHRVVDIVYSRQAVAPETASRPAPAAAAAAPERAVRFKSQWAVDAGIDIKPGTNWMMDVRNETPIDGGTYKIVEAFIDMHKDENQTATTQLKVFSKALAKLTPAQITQKYMGERKKIVTLLKANNLWRIDEPSAAKVAAAAAAAAAADAAMRPEVIAAGGGGGGGKPVTVTFDLGKGKESFDLDFSSTDTVADAKHKLKEKKGINYGINLWDAGKNLDDDVLMSKLSGKPLFVGKKRSVSAARETATKIGFFYQVHGDRFRANISKTKTIGDLKTYIAHTHELDRNVKIIINGDEARDSDPITLVDNTNLVWVI